MKTSSIWQNILRINFEYRVVISYLLFGVALITLIFSKNYTYNIIADYFLIDRNLVMFITFLSIGILNLLTWIFRSYAGGYLTGHTAVTKSVQTNHLVTSGPYAYVRNPLYLSDTIAMTSIGFAGPPVAILILLLGKIITSYMYALYEEHSLRKRWGKMFIKYFQNVPRFIPKLKPYMSGLRHKVTINWKDGLAYNFYAFGIGVAFLIAAFTQNRAHLYVFGFITPVLWFFLRFIDRHILKLVKK